MSGELERGFDDRQRLDEPRYAQVGRAAGKAARRKKKASAHYEIVLDPLEEEEQEHEERSQQNGEHEQVVVAAEDGRKPKEEPFSSFVFFGASVVVSLCMVAAAVVAVTGAMALGSQGIFCQDNNSATSTLPLALTSPNRCVNNDDAPPAPTPPPPVVPPLNRPLPYHFLSFANCSDGWIGVPTLRRCYRLYPGHQTHWDVASNWCNSKREGASLAEVTTPELASLARFVAAASRHQPWVGASRRYKDGRWRWNSGTEVDDGFWAEGKAPSSGHCAYFDDVGLRWEWEAACSGLKYRPRAAFCQYDQEVEQ